MTRKHKKPRYGLCPKCHKGQMKPDGIAWKDNWKGSPDFIGDTGDERGCTMSQVGSVKLQNCFKCHKCGHSESIKEEN